MRSKAYRRHKSEIIKKKWKKRLFDKIQSFGSDATESKDEILKRADDPREIGLMASTHGSLCSCHMCGNPRKYFNEKTMQEKKSDDIQKSLMKDIDQNIEKPEGE